MITVNNLCKAYGDRPVLQGVSTHFPRGQLTSLIGPNGAGKSTLLMLLARLLEADSGDITLDERPAHTLPVKDYARLVATLRQSPAFNLRLTVQELVAFGRFPYSGGRLTQEDQQQIDQALHFLDLDSLRHRYLDAISGGQRQMAFLAMTIAQQTPCLLLDEPLNNLDIRHAVHIMRALRRLCDEQGRTVVLVVHDLNFAANYSDRILAMKDGQIQHSGPVSEVIEAQRLEQLYGLRMHVQRNEHGYLCNYFTPAGDFQCT